MHGLRPEYQERVNFVILDYDRDEDLALARRLGVAFHPAYALVAPGADGQVTERLVGPQQEPRLRRLLDEAAARFAQ